MPVKHELQEREKELDCLYRLSLLLTNYDGQERELFPKIERELQAAMTYPKETRFTLNLGNEVPPTGPPPGETYFYAVVPQETAEYLVLKCTLQKRGLRLEHRERFLLESVLRLTAGTLQRLRNAAALSNKNVALTEFINHMQDEKVKTNKTLSLKINAIIFPLLNQIEIGLDEHRQGKLKLIKEALSKLTQESQQSLSELFPVLSPREREICTLIVTGSSTKEMADMLGISAQTVERHRCTIRKKLGLNKTGINLYTHLINL